MGLCTFKVEIEAGKFHVRRLGDLDVAFRAVHHVNIMTQPLD